MTDPGPGPGRDPVHNVDWIPDLGPRSRARAGSRVITKEKAASERKEKELEAGKAALKKLKTIKSES